MRRLLIAFLLTLAAQSVAAEDLDAQQVRFGFEDNSDPGYPNCTLAAYITNFPAPEFVNVRFRVDAQPQSKLMFFSITTDVGEQLYKDGKPSSTRTIPIDQAEFLAEDFDSLGRMHTTLDSGGVQQSTNDATMFPILLLDFQSGHFIVRFRREGSSAIRGYTVNAEPSATMVASSRFRDCVTGVVASFGVH